ncbi:hypothetical protein [Rhodopirellula sp. MGV]|uniref:hypothetical protein n=1 Tax=Rhodopirellula sp. MGV TaxID=2023130 RepID=UPI000B95F4F2|nr:hypothetical protein [Rhodopirellula sp. MGV]OYP33031.1 hypothetical protein CGZ80_19275 [Rhodopirellula sp. MGV]PNY35306.1 hypothetical protein C2E31_17405 [Rhodopirellula baltica]
MVLWPSNRWGYSRSDDADEFFELDQPFALIGAHPRCQIRLDYKRLPEVVYFIAIIGDRVQAWPLCAIAYPTWGNLKSGRQILIGKLRVNISAQTGDQPWDHSPLSPPGDAVNDVSELPQPEPESPRGTLILDWGEETQTRKLTRSVTILGNSHPSLMRLHGVGLHACELAIVSTGERIWAIQLNPDSIREQTPLIRELAPGGESIWVGDLHIWAKKKGHRSKKRFGIPTPPEPPSKSIPPPTISGATPQYQPVRPSLEHLAVTYTDRLLSVTSRRASRDQMVRWAVSGGLLVFSLIVFAFITLRGVLPIVKSVYSD